MTRGSPIVYVGASIVTPLIVYEILAVMGWEAVLGWTYTVLLLLFTTPVGIAAWVFQDARDRGWNGTFWAIVSILAPIPFGPVIYLLARSERRNAASRTHGVSSRRCRHTARSVHTRLSPRMFFSAETTAASATRRLP